MFSAQRCIHGIQWIFCILADSRACGPDVGFQGMSIHSWGYRVTGQRFVEQYLHCIPSCGPYGLCVAPSLITMYPVDFSPGGGNIASFMSLGYVLTKYGVPRSAGHMAVGNCGLRLVHSPLAWYPVGFLLACVFPTVPNGTGSSGVQSWSNSMSAYSDMPGGAWFGPFPHSSVSSHGMEWWEVHNDTL